MTAFLVEAVGILAFLTNVWANILIAHKSERGWWIRLVSNVFWLAFGIAAFSVANILNAVTFACINVYGLRRWKREAAIAVARCGVLRCTRSRHYADEPCRFAEAA